VMAPSMPFYADYLWRSVREVDAPESVHLAAWPEVEPFDPVVLGEMSLVREFVTAALEARTKAGIKVRQPLQKLILNVEMEPQYAAVICDEVNVKEVVFDINSSERVVLDTNITPELKMEGDARDFIRGVQEMRKEKGLAPSDRISLKVQAPDGGEAVVNTFEKEIKRVVGADSIEFTNTDGNEIKAGEHSFVVEFK